MVHMVAPSPAVVQPMGQSMQVEDPLYVEKAPTGHCWHEVELVLLVKFPAGHGVHEIAPKNT